MIDRLWRGPTVMKGLNSSQQGKAIADAWQSFKHPVCVMLDAVRFDQHVSVPILNWEHSVYLEFFHPAYRHELQWLLSMQLFNRGRIRCPDGVLSYEVSGCRASGDMNTAMGNVLIMCAMVYAFVHRLGVEARLINNGDDCCLLVERENLDLVQESLPKFFAELGFIIEVEGVARELEHVHFCQTRPVFDGSRWRMVRDPATAISKDATLLRHWNPKEHAAYLHELGVAGEVGFGDMPIWGSFYRCLKRAIGDGDISDGLRRHVQSAMSDSGLWRLSTGMSVGREITWQSRASFAMAFGISPVVQRYLESYYDCMSPGDWVVHPGFAVSRMF